MAIIRSLLIAAVLVSGASPAFAQGNFGFFNTKPSGQPYLAPAESVKRFQAMPGWEVKLVAAEPDIINPIAFTIDEKGRLWVVECFEYPKRTPKGKKPRDRIKIIEETPNGPKVTIWAEGKDLPIGFDMASGIEVGNGGVYLGAPPYLFFLSDPDNTGKCTKQEILLKGFGSQDTHETLNTFQWGPDSKLYGLHGVFTNSVVDGVKLNAAIWRYDADREAAAPAKGKFEIFAEGTSNPWGMDFDKHGQCFLACCVIPHLFHVIPGATYIRQAGTSFNPYAFGQLKEICDHIHHKHSGWAHAGLMVLEGDHLPEAMRGSLIMGSIHGCSIQHDDLRHNGSSFIGTHGGTFLASGDRNFRPINLRWGPDGSIYVIDWHDIYPCHQTPADAWDLTHGRIYKIRRTDAKPGLVEDMSKRSSKELVEILKENNPYRYRTALRLLHERRDLSVFQSLRGMLLNPGNDALCLRALWGIWAIGFKLSEDDLAYHALEHTSPHVRAWVVRLMSETQSLSKSLTVMARTEPSPIVRLELAAAAQRYTSRPMRPLLHNLMMHKEDAKDPAIPLMIWLAYEPRLKGQVEDSFDLHPPPLVWLKGNAAGNELITDEIVPRVIRRLLATGKAEDLQACIGFLGDAADTKIRRRVLDAFLLAFKNRVVEPPGNWKQVFARLQSDTNADIQNLANRVALHFLDVPALDRALAILADATRAVPDRIEAIRAVTLTNPPRARKVLLNLLLGDEPIDLRIEACRALAGYDQPELAAELLTRWPKLPPPIRQETLHLLASRKTWASELMLAVGKGTVPRTDLHNNTILRIRGFKDKTLNDLIEKHWGRFRDTPKDLALLIDKMRVQLHEGKGSFTRGKLVFEQQCAKCHKFEGKGHEVGPNLDGAARDIEYLLINVIDPNRVVGQPYYMRSVELKNGRIETGLLFAEDEMSITLKGENDVLKVIAKKDIEGKVIVHEKSVMPEGLANNMTPQNFRDLVRYMMAHPFLTQVKVAGPFPWPAAKVNEPAAVPESDWLVAGVGPPGKIVLPSGKKNETVSLATAEVMAPSALRTRLLLGAAQPVHVWLNNKLVYRGRPGSPPASPDQSGIEVELRAGANHLVFQLTNDGGEPTLYARFLDPERRLQYPEK